MRDGFAAFSAAHHLAPNDIRHSDFVLVRLLFEATRDAGFWNLHWRVTDQPPNSDRIWQQWHTVRKPSPLAPTAKAECDELSALYAFLVERAVVKSVGLLWPYPNHTVAVWTVRPTNATQPLRIVVPTTQIFLEPDDRFDTHKFDPWRQKNIYEYTRRDVPDIFAIPRPLADFFLAQIDKYAGASDFTLQSLRYLRDSVLTGELTPSAAARDARDRLHNSNSLSLEDHAAFENFVRDLGATP
jgi:hypothetical protein